MELPQSNMLGILKDGAESPASCNSLLALPCYPRIPRTLSAHTNMIRAPSVSSGGHFL